MPVEDVTIRALDPQDERWWLQLAAEVEPLFGPMVGDSGFLAAIRNAIGFGNALGAEVQGVLVGIVAFDREANEITWLAVGARHRGRGYGELLIKAAVQALAADRDVFVQTFAPHVAVGCAARRLYLSNGFVDVRRAELNPAGIETVIMRRHAQSRCLGSR